ncbi:MAG TPA: DUF2071 domain-containing protein [Gemmatimonadales bacterium]|nr:DUF2071 domain-containing protein [Gemmatimonadales bacterium]
MTPFLTASWRNLLMLNYEIDPAVLAPRVPACTSLDQWQGHTYVTLVGFQFLGTRLLGIPVPFHGAFEEVNLRFYVRRAVDADVRRGVVFIRELVPHRAIAAVARALYNEPYQTVPMRSDVTHDPETAVTYSWQLNGRWHTLAGRRAGGGTAAEPGRGPGRGPGSHEDFITEHYWGYTRQRDGGTLEYRVEHPRWRVWAAADVQVDADLSALYGPELARWLERPASMLLADGSAVRVGWPRRVT